MTTLVDWLTEEEHADVFSRTDVDELTLKALTGRYNLLDDTDGRDGAPLEDCIVLPEVAAMPFGRLLVEHFQDTDTLTLRPHGFCMIVGLLFPDTSPSKKRDIFWEVLGGGPDGQGEIGMVGMMRFYTTVFRGALTDTQIERLLAEVMKDKQFIRFGNFEQLVSDHDIALRLTCEFLEA